MRSGEREKRQQEEEGLLKSQFEEWLNSLDINAGVWGHLPLLADLFP